MSRRGTYILIAALLLIGLPQAMPDAGADSVAPPAVRTITEGQGKDVAPVAKVYTKDDDGKTVLLKDGDVFRVELDFQGGTGYQWYPDGLDVKTVALKSSCTAEDTEADKVGGPMLGVWTFEAVSPGDTDLTMLYYRVWEGKAHAVKTFHLRLHIAPR